MSNDLLIKINADAKNAKKAFDDVRAQTEDLENTLGKVAVVSGLAFAALTAEVYLSVRAFEEARIASAELSNALQNQGIFTEELVEQYNGYADAVQRATGIDNDAIKQAQAVAQTYLGQTKITEELTYAIADLGTKMKGDFNGAAEKIAKTIGAGTNAFAKQGLQISETATEAERYGKVLEFVQAKAGGIAAEFDKADGGARRLATAFGNFQESVGERFAPIIEAGRRAAAAFFELLSENSFLSDLTAALIAAGVAVTGIITALAVGIPAFLALKAAVIAFGISMNVAFVGIPLLIGAVVAGVTLLALNWDKAMALIVSTSKAAMTFVTELFGGLGRVLAGAFTLDPKLLNEGLTKIKESLKATKETFNTTYSEITASQIAETEKQNAAKKAAADREAAQERQHQANLRAIRAAETEILRLEVEGASQQLISIKQKELEVLKALDQEKSAEQLALLREKQQLLLAEEQLIREQDLQASIEFEQQKQLAINELKAQGYQLEYDLSVQQQQKLQAQIMTDKEIEQKIIEEKLKNRIETNNKFLEEQRKFGTAYATINKFITSEEVQGAKTAAGELVQLQQSKNQQLKEIGKVAAVAQITISTAESAMNIYKGFSTIPIIGPALGIAGAAAAVAFGAERIGQVTSAADGGLIEGGIAGKDSVPALLMPGELVVPRRNFDDVVGSVRGESQDNGEVVAALNRIEEKISGGVTNVIQGDVLADDSYIDALGRKLSDWLEFRNGQLFGVTA